MSAALPVVESVGRVEYDGREEGVKEELAGEGRNDELDAAGEQLAMHQTDDDAEDDEETRLGHVLGQE